MTGRTEPTKHCIKIWVSPDEIEKFAGKKLLRSEMYHILHKLPDLIWDFVGEDGMETFVRGILEE